MHSTLTRRSLLAAIAALAVLPALPRQARAATPQFGGRYEDGRIVVELSPDGDNYTGTIRMGDKQFPLSAHVEDGQLRGRFSYQNTTFPFTAALAGVDLTFITGGATYVLKNTNPVSRPAVAADAVKPGNIFGKWAVSGDFGGERFTLTFGPKGDTLIESSNGSSSSGVNFTYANNTLTFNGSSQINKFSVGGTWKVQWNSADEFTTTDDQGKPLTLRRAVEGK